MPLIGLIAIALTVQNCDYVSEGPIPDASERSQASADAMPFAFDLDIDHIAYMSCRGASFYETPYTPFFTFRAGGYESGSGISFRKSFLEEYASLTKSRLIDLLELSSRNRKTGVVMSVRETGQFQNVIRFQEEGGGGGDEGNNIRANSMDGLMYDEFQTLTDERVLDLLLDQRETPVNYLRGLATRQSNRVFEGSIRLFSQDESRAGSNEAPTPPANGADKIYRDLLQDQAYLTFTFVNDEGESELLGLRARSPFTPVGTTQQGQRSVWGKGYQFNFSEYDNFVTTGYRSSSQKRSLTQVRAYNLENEASLDENWVCPNNEKYIVVRQVDATRRYDGRPINSGNHPFNEYDRLDPTDVESDLNTETSYNDGGAASGGYYYTYQKDYDGNNELDYVRHKVICPLVADQIPREGDPATQLEREAWKRVRRMLPIEDWYVFRGSKYNCVVPKNVGGDFCYAGGANLNEGLDAFSPRNLIQYFADEDHPDIRIAQEREDLADENNEIEEIQVTPDCGPSSGVTHGGRNYCPHVVSICYRLN